MQLTTQPFRQPLGTSGEVRRRLLRHYVPLALASALVLVLFTNLSPFDANKYPPGNIFTGSFPREDFPGGQASGVEHELPPGLSPERLEQIQGHSGPPGAMGESLRPGGKFVTRMTVATGYVATGLLALTLLLGPANLLLRRRTPISTYLTRDVGMSAAVFSVVHVFFGLEVHSKITDPFPMFIQDGDPLTNSFGLANWTGLAATVIVVGLLAISSDFALGKLKARFWKNIQRLNYVLFALVIVHAFFYDVLLRTDSPYTLLLVLSVIAVFAGQAVGVWLWRRRHARPRATAVAGVSSSL